MRILEAKGAKALALSLGAGPFGSAAWGALPSYFINFPNAPIADVQAAVGDCVKATDKTGAVDANRLTKAGWVEGDFVENKGGRNPQIITFGKPDVAALITINTNAEQHANHFCGVVARVNSDADLENIAAALDGIFIAKHEQAAHAGHFRWAAPTRFSLIGLQGSQEHPYIMVNTEHKDESEQ